MHSQSHSGWLPWSAEETSLGSLANYLSPAQHILNPYTTDKITQNLNNKRESLISFNPRINSVKTDMALRLCRYKRNFRVKITSKCVSKNNCRLNWPSAKKNLKYLTHFLSCFWIFVKCQLPTSATSLSQTPPSRRRVDRRPLATAANTPPSASTRLQVKIQELIQVSIIWSLSFLYFLSYFFVSYICIWIYMV